jgi:hypothetical protein
MKTGWKKVGSGINIPEHPGSATLIRPNRMWMSLIQIVDELWPSIADELWPSIADELWPSNGKAVVV